MGEGRVPIFCTQGDEGVLHVIVLAFSNKAVHQSVCLVKEKKYIVFQVTLAIVSFASDFRVITQRSAGRRVA